MIDLDIVVVANRHRPALITEYLTNIPHIVSYTEDFNIPEGLDLSKYNYLNTGSLGAYRCFRGHQEALKKATKDTILIFEDDAVPNRQDWIECVDVAAELLNEYNIVSLHGRGIKGIITKRVYKRKRFVNLKDVNNPISGKGKGFVGKWALGSLAYLLKKSTAEKIISSTYDGLPMDLLIINRYSSIIMEPSPFNHDRKHGSLVDKLK